MQTISSNLASAIKADSQNVTAKVVARFADSRYMDNLVITSNDNSFGDLVEAGSYFPPYQAVNTIEDQTFSWAVTDVLDENGNEITANGKYYVMPDEYSEDEEFGWWSKGMSDGTGSFTTSPWIRYDFDQRKANKIEVVTAYEHGRIDEYVLEYVNTSDVLVSVGTFNMAAETTRQAHDLGGVLDIKGVKITVNSTQNPNDFARVHELIPAYDAEITESVVGFDINQEREHYEDGSSPIGHVASASGSFEFENTEKLFNVDGISDYAPYVRVDTRLDASLGWELGSYLSLPGITDNFAETAYYSDLDVVEDLDIRWHGRLAQVGSSPVLVDHWQGGSNQGYMVRLRTNCTVLEFVYGRGGGATTRTVVHGVPMGEDIWFRITRVVSSGDVTFQKSSDGVSWNTIGTANILAGTVPDYSSNGLSVGGRVDGGTDGNFLGRVYYAEVRKGLDGEIVASVDFKEFPAGTTSFGNNGRTWTINQSGGTPAEIVDLGTEYVNLGKFYVDNWSVSDSMQVTAGVRDRSKFIQESVIEKGYMRSDITAAEGIRDLAKMAGVGVEYLKTHDPYQDNVIRRNPKYYWPMNDKGALGKFGGSFAGEVVEELQSGLNGTIVGTGISQGNPGLIAGAGEYSTEFGQINGSHILIPHDNGMNFDGNFSVEFMMRPSSFPTSNRQYLFGKTEVAHNETSAFFGATDANKHLVFGVGFGTGNGFAELIHSKTLVAESIYHVVCEVDVSNQKLHITIDGETESSGVVLTQPVYTNSEQLVIGAWFETYTGFNDEFDGDMSHFCLYDFSLSQAAKQKAYESANVSEIEKYGYFYASEETIWDSMLEWATADLGTFYFDENEYFHYDYNNALYQPVLTRHSVSQYSLSDDEEIIGGNYNVDLQTNKVIVKVNPITTLNTGVQQIWRAEQGESLAVTESDAQLDTTDTEIIVETTEFPPWPESGYFKMGDEIIGYSGKTSYKFLNLERDVLGTPSLVLPGTTGNYASTPDKASLDITGDIDLRADASLTDWTPPTNNRLLVGKWASNIGYILSVTFNTGLLRLTWDGSGANSTVAPTVSDGARLAVRATRNATTGDIQFFTAPTLSGPWTQLGSTVTSTPSAITTNSESLLVGGFVSSQNVDGTIHSVEVRDGIDGTIVASPRFDKQEVGTTNFTDAQGNVWTVNQSGSPQAEIEKSGVQSYPSGTLVREARNYNIEYAQTPAVSVRRPFISAVIFDDLAEIDMWRADSYEAEAWVSATADNEKNTIVILEGTNPDNGANNYFSIAGIPIVEITNNKEVIEKVESLNDNIRKYGKKELIIDNKFIQSEKRATDLARFLITNFGTPVSVINLDITGVPHVELGDRITVASFDQLDITSKDYWLVGKVTRFDGGVQNSIILREAS